MFRDSIIAATRTGIAALVGLFITWLVTSGVEVGPDVAANLNVALFGLFTALYNVAVILLERKVHPYFGILLGVPKSPAYGDVGTQTAPPADPLVGDPRVDMPGDEAGNFSVIGAGLVSVAVGLVLYLLSTAVGLAQVLLVVGAVVIVAGVVLSLVSGRRTGV